ncbi:MAG TPA: hypothetical protein VFH56_14625 [Acidimicrobiales bacterium]|nr:hypothetical protein [Acidimicrobiales bacterium]
MTGPVPAGIVEAAEIAHVVTDASDDPVPADDCPGCEAVDAEHDLCPSCGCPVRGTQHRGEPMTEDTVTGNFVRPCLTCGNTVRVVDTVEQPHHCEPPGPVAELVARAWWAGYDAARSDSAAPSGEQRKEGQR